MKVYYLQKPYKFGGFISERVAIKEDKDNSRLLSLLKDGWEISTCQVDDIYDGNWRIDDKSIIEKISSIVESSLDADFIYVGTTHYTDCVYMYIDCWKKQNAEQPFRYTATLWVTVKDTTNPLFEFGQEQANKVLELIKENNIYQYKDGLIKLLERQGY